MHTQYLPFQPNLLKFVLHNKTLLFFSFPNNVLFRVQFLHHSVFWYIMLVWKVKLLLLPSKSTVLILADSCLVT